MRNRIYSMMLLVAASMLGTALFMTSGQVQHKEKIYAAEQEKLSVTRASVKMLQAEWAYLNRPDRLEELATTYLDLAPQPVPTIAKTAALLPNEETKQNVANIAPAPTSKPKIIKARYRAPTIAKKTLSSDGKPTPRFDQLLSRVTRHGGNR